MRRTGICASEAAVVLGLIGSPHELWRKKVEGWEEPENDAMKRGEILEPAIANWYGWKTRHVLAQGVTTRHATHERILATPDRLAYEAPVGVGIEAWTETMFPGRTQAVSHLVELKSCGWRMSSEWGEPGTDEVPQHYRIQVVFQMAVMDVDQTDICVLLGGDFRIYRIARDRELEETVIAKCEEWWRAYVETKTPPPVDGSEGCAKWLSERFPRVAKPELLKANEEADYRARRLALNLKDLRSAELAVQADENWFKSIIADDLGIETAVGVLKWAESKGRPSWKEIAIAAGATPDLIAQHTGAPSRRFSHPFRQKKEEE